MLLIKCPQCNRSYRLAESLYRRKAAGFGVVITCRHCKTQIHVDEGVVPTTRHVGDPLDLASESDETDVPSVPDLDIPEPPPSSGAQALPLIMKPPGEAAITELEAPTLPPVADIGQVDAIDAPTLPPVRDPEAHVPPPVAPRAAAVPRPTGGAPRPGGVPRPGASATGTPLPRTTTSGTTLGLGRPLVSATATPTPSDAVTPTPGSGKAGARPKMVALSPGLLGVKTAPKEAAVSFASKTNATATPKPGVPSPAAMPKPVIAAPAPPLDDETVPISAVPLSIPDSELFAIDSKPPDSAVPIDSVDYLESVRPVAPALPKGYERALSPADDADATPIPHAREKRLPHAPAAPHAPRPHAHEEPEDLTAKRKRLPSGDLTDDLLSNDLSFDAAPALAPPDASALLRAPVSVRPSAQPSSQGSTKAPVSKTASAPAEKKGGRGVVFVLLAAAAGAAFYFWSHRVPAPSEAALQENAAVTPPAPREPAAPPAAETPSAAAAETPSAASEPSAAAASAPAAPVATEKPAQPTETAANLATSSHGEKSAKAHGESSTDSATTTKAAATSEEQAAATPKSTATSEPASTAALEPRGSAGTDPFDVAAARTALAATAAQASSCRKPGDPSGVAVVTMTFSQSGRVTTAQISGPPFQATPTGGCIASTMRKTRVPAFAGDMVTVRKTVTIE